MPILSSDISTKVNYYSGAPLDKIVGVWEGSFDTTTAPVVGGYLQQHTFSHGFTRPLFTKLLWSKDQITWVDGGLSYISGDPTFDRSISYSTTSDIGILTGYSTGTLYYKVIGFWIDSYDGTNPTVAPFYSGDTVQFDSRLNYQKIYTQGEFTPASGSPTLTSIPHDLGYRPNVRAYCETYSGEIWPATYGGVSAYFDYDPVNYGALSIESKTTTVDFNWYGGASRRCFYIVYYDA